VVNDAGTEVYAAVLAATPTGVVLNVYNAAQWAPWIMLECEP
jgi:hypothetical protein